MAAGTALGIAGVLAGDNYGYEGTILVVGLGLGVASGVVLGIPMGAARGSKEKVVFPNKKWIQLPNKKQRVDQKSKVFGSRTLFPQIQYYLSHVIPQKHHKRPGKSCQSIIVSGSQK